MLINIYHDHTTVFIPDEIDREVGHGHWLPSDIPDSILDKCSECGFDTGAFTFRYCPNCGAKMDGGQIEEEDRRSLPDRIKEAIEEYGVVMIDIETSKKFFHADVMDFWNAIEKLKDEEGYKIQAYIGKGDTNE